MYDNRKILTYKVDRLTGNQNLMAEQESLQNTQE